jgi:2-phospho-L-lactate guanylyltransferase (CobY/MobA/RfbA family)
LTQTSLGAVILATRETGFSAASELGEQSAPLVEIAGRTLVERVVAVAQGTKDIGPVVVVGGEECPAAPFGADLGLPASDSPAANLLAGLMVCEDCSHAALLPGTLPFLTQAELEGFLSAAMGTAADVVYPMVRREACEGAFPELRRNCFRLAEGEVTGGNALFVNRQALVANPELIARAVQIRREPWRLALMVSPLMVLSFNAGRLGLRDIAQAAEKAMGLSAAAVIVDAPGLATDVRKPIDLRVAREKLS